jgi:hypothetical protein
MSQNIDDRVTIYLAIESVELPPSILTARLGVRPDSEWVIGDARGKTGKHWECHGWVVETTVCSEENGGRSASELVPIAMERFERRVGPFAGVAFSLGDSTQRYAVLNILAGEVPGIELTHSFLQLLADLGGTFQIDLSIPASGRLID